MNHNVGRSVFALVIGLVVAILAFQWITDPVPRVQRAAEEQAVQASRELLRETVGARNESAKRRRHSCVRNDAIGFPKD